MTTILTESFENHTDWTHNCRVFRAAGNAEDVQVGNIFVPGGWRVWWDEANGYVQPEGRHCHFSVDKRRIRTGAVAYQLFTFGKLHHAGLSREFEVGAWKRVRVTAYPHAWSNHRDGPHKDDGKWSEWAGYEEVSIAWDDVQVQTQAQTTGDQQLDAQGNIRFRVGLGGADLASVNWGDGVCVYNDYQEPVTIEGLVGESGKVTVWLESTVLWEFTHCDAFWDDVTVEVLDGEPELPTPPEPPVPPVPPSGRGKPRVQYERTYVLLPPDANLSELHDAVDQYSGHTIGMSADDAGVGDLDKRNVIAIRPEAWPSDPLQFFKDYYPGVNYAVGSLDGDENPPEPPDGILLAQRDARWANTHFGASSCSLTIGQSGCFITSLAMAQRVYGIKADATPVTVDAALTPAGYTGCLARWDAINAKLGMTISGATMAQVLTHLDAGGCAMAEVSPETLQHFVLVTRHEGLRCWILDPWKNVEGWLDDYYIGVDSWRMLGKNGPAPEPEPPPVAFNPRSLSMHLQTMVAGSLEYARDCRPSCVKRVQGAQDLITLHNLNPGMACVYRAYPEGQTAADHVAHNLDTLKQVCDAGVPLYFEGPNEVYGGDRASNARWVEYEREFVRLLKAAEPRCKPVTFCAAVGNPPEDQYDLLVPLARETTEAGGMLGYHGYWGANPTWCSLDDYNTHGRWLQYRWEMIDAYLTARGVYPRWFLGETGAVEATWYPATTTAVKGAMDQLQTGLSWESQIGKAPDPWHSAGRAVVIPGRTSATRSVQEIQANASTALAGGWYQFGPNDGWKSSACLNGNWTRYLADLERVAAHLYAWNVSHGGRCVGGVLFTSGQGVGWLSFLLAAEQLNDIRAMQVRLFPIV